MTHNPVPHRRNGAVVSVGRLYCDLVFTGLDTMPQLGKEIFAGGVSLSGGGGAYITAAYLSALGRHAILAATLPQDPFGSAILPEIRRNGVDLSALESAPLADATFDPQITVAIATNNDRAFLTRQAGISVPKTLTTALDVPNVTHLHIGEIATLIDRPDLIDIARAKNLTISLDCSWNDAAINHPDALALIAKTDIFMPNDTEATALFAFGETQIEAAAIELSKLACISVIKCGALGAGIAMPTGLTLTPSPKTKVTDTTGAGDAFNAGFLDAWLSGAPIKQCLAQGVQCGSFAVAQSGGAVSLPKFDSAPIAQIS